MDLEMIYIPVENNEITYMGSTYTDKIYLIIYISDIHNSIYDHFHPF